MPFFTKKIGSLAPAYVFASQFSKSKNLSKTAISKSRSKQSQKDLKFITHHASVLHTTHNTQVICLSHTQENTRSKIIDSHHKDSQTKKINNRARVRRRPCPRRPTAAGVPDPCAWPRAAVAARQAPARAGLGGCCWSALHPSAPYPPAYTRPCCPRRPAAAAARRPACAAACARAAAGRPPPASVRRLARPCPRRGGAHRRELGVGGVRAGGEEKFTGRRCRGKKKEIRDGERGAVKINKRMSIEVSP